MRRTPIQSALAGATVALALLLSSAPAALASQASQVPQLGVELAARTQGAQLTFVELDQLLLRRNGLTPVGRAALREIIDLKVLGHLAQERGVVISQSQLNRRWSEIEKEVVATGQAANMAEFLEASGVNRATFSQYLKLSLIQESLARLALGLPKDSAVTAEQQKLWLESEMEMLGYKEEAAFWDVGVVCTLGPIQVTTAEFGKHLRDQLDPKDVRQACYEILLLKKIRARFPDLAPAAEAQAIEEEIQLRRKDIESNERYKGVKYEDLLQAQGITMDSLRLDPALRAAALSRLWVNRTCNDACLREFYEGERENFDGHFGEGVETYAILLNAAKLKNDMNPRTFEEAEAALQTLRDDITNLDNFKAIAGVRTDDVSARSSGGLIGWVRRRTAGVDPAIRQAVNDALNSTPGVLKNTVTGPLRVQGGVVLLCLGQRAAAPTWDIMSSNVHRELRRRFMVEQLPPTEFECWLTPARK
ncbi:MAG: peptidylprolyl isomerase [Planctomycetota bacterium]|nr:peptidylprolyl isomerase [Planctomycetota bacterium]